MDDLDYDLPESLIATRPAEPRDSSRLLVYRRSTGLIDHRRFADLPAYLAAGDLMVVNDTRVVPAKLELAKPSGAYIPGLFIHEERPGLWQVMLRSRGKIAPGDQLILANGQTRYTFKVGQRLSDKGQWHLEVSPADDAATVLNAVGHTPLPPYIEKMRHPDDPSTPDEAFDRSHYQTVYAREGKSVAAPTAGLHFTPALLDRLATMGVIRTAVTLEVGLGTFAPVETETLEDHKMHTEEYIVPAETIAALRAQRAKNGRIVVVGTTAVRTLESTATRILDLSQPADALRGTTNLCISPGYTWQLTDILITNFHLPRSTLLALIAARVGLEEMHRIYRIAVADQYRFFSYGDAMVILP